MKHFFIAFLLLITSCTAAFAQDDDGKNWEKIKAIKVSYITEHVHLTSEQSTRFWPVYNGYQQDRRSMRKDFMDKFLSANAGATRSQARAALDADLDYQAKELDLKRRYKDRLLQVISEQQLNQLYEAERDFKKILLDQLRSSK